MAEVKEKMKVPVKEGIYVFPVSPGEQGYIIGSKCQDCGRYAYPSRKNCAGCGGERVQEVALSRRGKIWSYMVARTGYPRTHLEYPVLAAIVELPEKVWVMTAVYGIDFDDVKIGTEVELYFFKIGENEEKETIAFAFRPVSS